MFESVTIQFDGDYITLDKNGEWIPSSKNSVRDAQLANLLSKPPFYKYSPAHGGYGTLMAHKIVEKIGGKVILPKSKKSKPGLIY